MTICKLVVPLCHEMRVGGQVPGMLDICNYVPHRCDVQRI